MSQYNQTFLDCCYNPAWNKDLLEKHQVGILGYPSVCDDFNSGSCPNTTSKNLKPEYKPIMYKIPTTRLEPIITNPSQWTKAPIGNYKMITEPSNPLSKYLPAIGVIMLLAVFFKP